MMRVAASGERGTTILEVIIASSILVTLMAGLLSLVSLAISTTENQGHLAARTTEYAQDKMEQLVALAYNDTTSDTRTFPAGSSGGSGLTVGGSSNTSAPVALYVDYLEEDGDLCVAANANCGAPSGTTPPAGWYYKRCWEITQPSANLKQITVTVTIAYGFGGGNKASSTLTVLKSSPF